MFPALTFERPVLLTHAGDGSNRVYVVEQHGVVHRIDAAAPGRTDAFLDIRSRVSRDGNEEGMLGLAFDPGFAANGRFYVYYSAASPRRSVLSRFETGSDGLGDAASESVLLEVPPAVLQPQRRDDRVRTGRHALRRAGRRRLGR